MPHINTMPDLILRTIFGKLDLPDVATMGLVCQLWRSYQHYITDKIDSLTLLIGSNDPLSLIAKSPFTIVHLEDIVGDNGKPMYPLQNGTRQTRLWFPETPSMDAIQQILKSFPSISNLQVVINDLPLSKVVYQIAYILQGWSANLTSLKLYCHFNDLLNDFNSNGILMGAVGCLDFLEHLTMDCNVFFYGHLANLFNIETDLPPQLRVLNFRSSDYFFDDLLDSFNKYLTANEHLEHFALANTTCEPMDGPKWMKFASKWSMLPFKLRYYDEVTYRSFSAITSVGIKFHPQSDLIKLINGLSALEELKCLELTLDMSIWMEYTKGRVIVDLIKYDSVPCTQITQLSSVKVLKLKIDSLEYHFDIKSDHWGWIFPELQVVDILHRCDCICFHYRNMQMNLDLVEESQQIDSIRTMVKTFKQCSKLRHIYTNFPYIKKWNRADLEA